MEGKASTGNAQCGTPEDISVNDRKLLSALGEQGALDEIANRSGVPRSTAHRRLLALAEAGLLIKGGAVYGLSEAGRRKLEGLPVAELPPRHFERRLDVLQLMPAPIHGAVVALVQCLVVARRQDLVEDLHAGVVLGGRTQKMKSWVVKVICALLGLDPTEAEVPAMQVRGRGLITRLDGRGEPVYQCEALNKAVVWINELRRAERQVRDSVMALVHGRKKVRIENNDITVEGVPVSGINQGRPGQRQVVPATRRRGVSADSGATSAGGVSGAGRRSIEVSWRSGAGLRSSLRVRLRQKSTRTSSPRMRA